MNTSLKNSDTNCVTSLKNSDANCVTNLKNSGIYSTSVFDNYFIISLKEHEGSGASNNTFTISTMNIDDFIGKISNEYVILISEYIKNIFVNHMINNVNNFQLYDDKTTDATRNTIFYVVNKNNILNLNISIEHKMCNLINVKDIIIDLFYMYDKTLSLNSHDNINYVFNDLMSFGDKNIYTFYYNDIKQFLFNKKDISALKGLMYEINILIFDEFLYNNNNNDEKYDRYGRIQFCVDCLVNFDKDIKNFDQKDVFINEISIIKNELIDVLKN